ncbi:hypothetical protein lerEdw1_003306 [Lerista edwardsae]|nr:hypothetical protein lerEdw1_003306 [Lerista edwardsae]
MDRSRFSLLVQVHPAAADPEKLRNKLQLYFQSPKNSGGGECTVEVQDRDRGVYRVEFASEEAKEGVRAQEEHCLKSIGMTLRILPDPEMMDTVESSLSNDLTKAAERPLSASNPQQLQKDLEKQHCGGKNAGDLSKSVTRKVSP